MKNLLFTGLVTATAVCMPASACPECDVDLELCADVQPIVDDLWDILDTCYNHYGQSGPCEDEQAAWFEWHAVELCACEGNCPYL